MPWAAARPAPGSAACPSRSPTRLADSRTEPAAIAARDGEEALAKIVADPEIDLVLLDINMPKMNGFEVLKELSVRGLVPALRVIVVTTEGRDEDAQRGLAAGAAAYLTKPFRADEVRAAIAALPDPT